MKLKIRFLEEESADYKEKNCKLRTHLQMVQQERANTEALLLERQRECDAAQHQLCLAEREIGRTKQDLHELKIKRGEIHVRMGSLEVCPWWIVKKRNGIAIWKAPLVY